MATIIEMLKSFRKLKADAVPRPPRSSKSEKIPPRQETSYSTQEPEEIFVEPEDYIETEDYAEAEENTKPSKNGKKNNCESGKEKKSKLNNGQHENGCVYVNAQAGGNVMNIINAVGLHVGPTINIGSMGDVMKQQKSDNSEEEEQNIKKSNLIKLLMEAEIKPEPKHLICVSKHLGKNWYSIFMKLGFTKGEIETQEIRSEPYGVKEARYQLLLEWVRKDDENTLGRLAKFLWDANERGVVKELAKVYNGGL